MPRGTSLVVGRSRSPAGINHAAVVPDLFGVTDVASALIPGAQLNGYDLTEVNTGPRFATTSSSGATSLSGVYDRVLFTNSVDFAGPCTFTDCEFASTIRPLPGAEGTTADFCAIRTNWMNPTEGNVNSLPGPETTTVEDNLWSPAGDSSNFDLITFYRCRSYGPAGHGCMRVLTGSTVTECLLIQRNTNAIMNVWNPAGDKYHSAVTSNGGAVDARWNRTASWMAGRATGHASLQGNFGTTDNVVIDAHYVLDIDLPGEPLSYFVMQGFENPSAIDNSFLTNWLIGTNPYPVYNDNPPPPQLFISNAAQLFNYGGWVVSNPQFYP